MEINEIEDKIARHELTAAQVFTQMMQHTSELARYSMSAGAADQFKREAMACRDELGFDVNGQDISPHDLRVAICKLKDV